MKVIRTLDTFIPPPVDPAQAPIIISDNKIPLEKVGQRLKSVVIKPVVVIIVATWKAAYLKDVKTLPYIV